MKKFLYLRLATAALLATGASAANAAQLVHFDITGGYTASFDLDTKAMPDYFSSTSFNFNDVSGVFAGTKFGGSAPASSTVASLVQFYSASFGGGIGISANGLNRFVEDGAQFYTGSTSAPTFLPGQYILKADGPDGYAASVLTITQSTISAVPEPATWAMMLAGFGMIGFAARKRSVVKPTITFA